VAFAALGSALAFIVQTLGDVQILDVVFGAVSLVATLASVFGLLGWLKLRRRDISALLEACGWALNGRMRLTRHLSLLFTRRPALPAGSVRRRLVPREVRPYLLTLVVIGLYVLLGWLWLMPSVALSLLGAWTAP
jgi:hypothetical protein